MKKVISFIVMMFVLLFVLTACGNDEVANNTVNQTSNKTSNTSKNTTENRSKEESKVNVNYLEAAQKQMAQPTEDETTAVLHIKDYGDIKVKFFKEVAPKAVENFVTHAKQGYYNGLTFHRVIKEFMIQGGDPEGTGMGGESIWGEGFGTELDYGLVPYRGALCMAMSSLPNSIGSQFFIEQANYDESMANSMKNGGYPEDLLEQYKTYGGSMHLYMQYTVFGQVYEGMEVVDKIAEVETDANDKPLENVVIESIEVKE